jgi:hypothetical protein
VSAAEVDPRLWERAFQLSYFVLMDRAKARESVARALEKLSAQQSREKRRRYWRGRKRQLTIRKITRPRQDVLQWLIYLESEAFEREHESQGHPTEADMVVRYVKHLAQTTTASSSFHVNVGFNRLLRNYTTTEVQQVYELATERYPAAEEYRKAKGKLLNQLAARFARFLKIRTAQYGELQFETHAEHEPWSGLVEECLEHFAPWSARGSCFEDDGGAGVRAAPYFSGSATAPDHLETSRCHWFMHSACLEQLVERLSFDPPWERLSVPRFLQQHDDGGDAGSSPVSSQRRTDPLSGDETRMLRERMVAAATNRDAIDLVPLKIVASGNVCARLDPRRDERHRFEIPPRTRLLEVRLDAPGDDRLLATHWLDCDENDGFVAGEYTLAVRGERRLTLSVIPNPEGDGNLAAIAIESHSVHPFASRLRSLRAMLSARPSLLGAALASVVLVAVGGFAASSYFQSRLSEDRALLARLRGEMAAQRAADATRQSTPRTSLPSVVRYAFGSDAPNLRGTGSSGEPVVTFASGAASVVIELPVHNGQRGIYRGVLSSFPQEQERLSEAALRPVMRAGRWIVEFTLPASLVDGDASYLLTLTETNGADSARYIFEVRKDSAISTH